MWERTVTVEKPATIKDDLSSDTSSAELWERRKPELAKRGPRRSRPSGRFVFPNARRQSDPPSYHWLSRSSRILSVARNPADATSTPSLTEEEYTYLSENLGDVSSCNEEEKLDVPVAVLTPTDRR